MSKGSRWLVHGLVFGAGIATAVITSRLLKVTARELPPQKQVAAIKPSLAGPKPEKPWGTIEALRIPLGEASEIFPDREVRLKPPRWFFEKYSEAQLTEFIKTCDLTEAQKTELVKNSNWLAASNGFVAAPTPPLVRGLSSSARQQIYEVLARGSQNYAQLFPFRFRFGDFASHFTNCHLSAAKLEALKSLTYTNCGDRCLADVELLPDLLTPDEFNCVVDSLYRVPTYRVRLRIYPDSDIDGLIRYWGKGGNANRIRPMLESLTKVPREEGASINVGYFFPTFARLRLNTFPDSWNEPQVSKEDCFWTSMNFFNERPDMSYLDPPHVREVLNTEYAPVSDEPTFGDLITLVSPNGDGLHMCVYIADDFVFTKNGMNQLAPWVLMKIPDMLLFFPSESAQQMVVFRRKNEPEMSKKAGLPPEARRVAE